MRMEHRTVIRVTHGRCFPGAFAGPPRDRHRTVRRGCAYHGDIDEGAVLAWSMCQPQTKQKGNRGKSPGTGMIIRFPRRDESDSLPACRRLQTSMAFRTPISRVWC